MIKGPLYLATQYVLSNRVKSSIMVLCLALTMVLPLAVQLMMQRFETRWKARAESTPLVIGSKGSEFDLVLQGLYFTDGQLDPIRNEEFLRVQKSNLAQGIPIRLGYSVQDLPIVGTSLDYFDIRGLKLADGDFPLILGDCVLGANAAKLLEKTAGDTVISDPENVFNIAGSYPLEMNIVGVLEPNGTPDDGAVFVDVKTSWIIEGIGHGHDDLEKGTLEDEAVVMSRDDQGNVVANAALVEYTRITKDNLSSFHFHEQPEELPLSAVLVYPNDQKSEAILRGHYLGSKELVQIVVPSQIIDEMLSIVLKVRRLFEANFVVIVMTTLLFCSLIVILSIRLRSAEMMTMVHLGCRRGTILLLFLFEYVLLVACAFLIAALLAWASVLSLDTIIEFLMRKG